MYVILARFWIVGFPPTIGQRGYILVGACCSYLVHLVLVKVPCSFLKYILSVDNSPHAYKSRDPLVHRLYAAISAVVVSSDIVVATGVWLKG